MKSKNAAKKTCDADKDYAKVMHHVIYNDVFRVQLDFCWGDAQAFEAFVRKRDPHFWYPPKDNPGVFVECSNGSRFIFIDRKYIHDAGVIAHECLHYVFSVARLTGLKYSTEGEEAFTYMLEHAVKHIEACIKKDLEP